MRSELPIVTLLALTVGLTGSLQAQCAGETEQLFADDGAAFDRFGWTLDLDGDRALVSARTKDDRTGSVYAFEKTGGTWEQTQEIRPQDAVPGYLFGDGIEIDGNLAIIGATQADTVPPGAGKLYVYEFGPSGWAQVAEIAADDAMSGDFFGFWADISGSTIVVGASRSDLTNPPAGKAYFFDESGGSWSQAQVVSGDGGAGDLFGTKVAIDGDRAVISAPVENGQRGAVYAYARGASSWDRIQRLEAPVPAPGAQYGLGIELAGDTLLVGAVFEAVDGQANAGRVYAYEWMIGEWVLTQELTSIGGTLAGTLFGQFSTVDGNRAIIGADRGGAAAGTAHVFERKPGGPWVGIERVVASDASVADFFGRDMALDGTDVLIGAFGAGSPVNGSAGKAYLFDVSGPDCNGDGVSDCFQLTEGLADCDNNGVLDACELESFDCNANGVHDACETMGDTYASDDGEGENFGLFFGGDALWLNSFYVRPFQEQIKSLEVAFGSGLPANTPVELLLYRDPNGDGEPSDAELIAAFDALTPAGGDGVLGWPIPPTNVGTFGESFFVGALVTHGFGTVPSRLDTDAAPVRKSWFGSGTAGAIDSADPGGTATFSSLEGFGVDGAFVLRARPTVAAGALGGLSVDRLSVSVLAGGRQTLHIRHGVANAGSAYVVVGSMSGFCPGTWVDGSIVPLNADAYSVVSFKNANAAPWLNTAGLLDAAGAATAAIELAPSFSTVLVGLDLHHASLVFDPSFEVTSNAVRLGLVP